MTEISRELAQSLREEIVLKKRLTAKTAEVKDKKQKIKEYMRDQKQKKLIAHGIKFTYTPKREYKTFYNQKMAIKYLEKKRPDLIVEKLGYESLRISLE